MDNLPLLAGMLALSGFVWFSWRYAWWRPSVDEIHPRILMYHMIRDAVPGARFNGMRVSPALFDKQVAYLKENGWHFYTVSELIEQWDMLPPKSVAITFDDGYADNVEQALPILKKHGAKGTVYLVVDRHQTEWSVNKKKKHDSGELKREPKLKDSQVMELIESGVIEIASHTMTHPNFADISTETKRKELTQSKNMLEARFGIEIKTFAYPFGILKEEDPDLIQEAGYMGAVTTVSGIDQRQPFNPFLLKRLKISGKEGMLAFKLRLRTGMRGANK